MSTFNRNSPLVSVVLCTYNDEKYIAETIQSVLSQTFCDFEFIIWNDGSTDSTEDIIKSYSDSRIRYFYHENTGLGIALSLACKEAQGKYIARIDGDDICLPHRLQTEFDYLECNTNVVLVSSSVIYINEKGEQLGRSFPWTWHRNILHCINIVHPATMYRTDIYKQTCGYLNVLACEDRILWANMKKYGKFHIIKEPLIMYRVLSTSLSHVIDINSPYSRMLEIIRTKMTADDIVKEEDIKLQNLVYRLSKKKNVVAQPYVYKSSVEERLFSLLHYLLPEKLAANIVFFLKNIYAYLRY